jgi:2-polyprenyl-3-methyl-5-hydroxy-6-metoxy-1,4-benzoquinol methylase
MLRFVQMLQTGSDENNNVLSPYYYSVRYDLIKLIPSETKKILEVGCAGGMTGKALREKGFDEIVGIEILEEPAQNAKSHYDKLIIGDVEKITLPFEKGHFDCILYGDVLEHLTDPWKLLKDHNALIKTGGIIICSIPNIRHYRIIKRLTIKGEWEYREDGIMDKTHLRFFTIKSIRSLLENSGFEITKIIKKPSGAAWIKLLNRICGNRFIDYLVRQYIVVAVKMKEANKCPR